MNICILTYLFYPEPIVMSTITEDLATTLAADHSVTVVTSKPCRPFGYKIPNNIEKASWPFKRVVLDTYTHPASDIIGRLKENFCFGRAASRYIHQHHSDIDVIYMNVFPLFAQKMVIKAAQKYGIKTVNHVEDIYPEPFRQKIPAFGNIVYKMLLPMDKWIINNATFSVVIGNQIREFFIRTRNANPHKIKVVYNWQEEGRFQMNDQSPELEGPFTFMYVGSISRTADLHTVLKAFVDADIKNARLIFAGSGTEKEALITEAKEHEHINVEFIDAPFDKISEIQAQSDVLILPLLKGVSLRAVPSKLPAYLFSHKPILACVEKESDVAEIIDKGSCGWISEPENSILLAESMKQISTIQRDVLRKMGEYGYSYAQNHLTKSVNLKKLADIVLSAAKSDI